MPYVRVWPFLLVEGITSLRMAVVDRLAFRQGECIRRRMAFAASKKDAVTELDVLWITAGLGCDGDTIAMTAATQPSIEDVLLGQIPWIPKVNLHNPFLAMANGDDFLSPFHEAAAGRIEAADLRKSRRWIGMEEW